MQPQEETEFRIFNALFSKILLLWEEYREIEPPPSAKRGGIAEANESEVRNKMIEALNEAAEEAEHSAIRPKIFEDVDFAISAFIDEVIEIHDVQEDRFMFKRFHSVAPEENLHVRLARNREHNEFSVLEIYLLCMLFGYRGREDDGACKGYIQDIRNRLQERIHQTELAPHWETHLSPNWKPSEISLQDPPKWWKPRWWQ